MASVPSELVGLRARGPKAVAAAMVLIALMAFGSALMWIGLPFGLIWLASHLQRGTDPSLGPYLVVLFGLPASMVAVGKLLAVLDRLFSRVTGYDPNRRRIPLPWHRSMRDERGSPRKRTVLDVVMIVSVAFAGAAFVIWFFVLAHPGVPQN